jgi:hypothetical protein
MDIPLDPIEGDTLVEEACVQVAVSLDLGAGQESQCAKSVVERDVNHLPVVFIPVGEEAVGEKCWRRCAEL